MPKRSSLCKTHLCPWQTRTSLTFCNPPSSVGPASASSQSGCACLPSGQPKEDFSVSAESRKKAILTKSYLQKYLKNRKRPFLPKEVVSVKKVCFAKKRKLHNRPKMVWIRERNLLNEHAGFWRKRTFSPKESISIERPKGLINSESLSGEFLPKDPFGWPLFFPWLNRERPERPDWHGTATFDTFPQTWKLLIARRKRWIWSMLPSEAWHNSF